MKNTALTDHYNRMWQDSLAMIQGKGFDFDPLIGSIMDHRYGITLLIRPDRQVRNSIQAFLDEVKRVEPDQYHYPLSDIHVTVMPIISCYEGFRLENIQAGEYIQLLKDCLGDIPVFNIRFWGVTGSPSTLMVKGFPGDHTLENVRDRLRSAFKKSALEQSLDKRYVLQTAHSTVVRFKNPVTNPSGILDIIDQWKDYEFGTCQVASLELVYNDWYQTEQKVKHLFSFDLG